MEVEYWDLYLPSGEAHGTKIKRGEAIPSGLYHRVVHIWIYNENSEFLIQKRADHLSWHPGKWATTTGSVISGSQNLIEESYRELSEELRLDNTSVDLELVQEILIGNSIVTILKGFMPLFKMKLIQLNEEVSEVKWMSKSKINILREKEEFASYSSELFEIVMKMRLD